MAEVSNFRPQRPRTSSMMSWGSHKSRDSQPKIDLTETERDKAQRRIKGKADPSVAINEIQPSLAAQEKSTLTPLRSMQFRDRNGDVITDPDRSNPTRPRMERPLDTIRSFEAAIDSSYGRSRHNPRPAERSEPPAGTQSPSSSLAAKTHESSPAPSYKSNEHQAGTPPPVYDGLLLTYMPPEDMQSRRSSMYSSYASPQARNPNGFSGYHDRQPESRPESIYEQQQPGGYGGYSNGYNGSRRMPHNRMNSEPVHNSYSQQRQHAYQNSYDTTTASSSGTYQTEQGAVSTHPSSYGGSNGDLNQVNQYAKPQPPVPQETYGIEFAGHQVEDYGQNFNGYGQPSPTAYGARGGQFGSPVASPTDMGAPPPPPPHANGVRSGLRKPVANGGNMPPPASNGYAGYDAQSPTERPKNEKRKSWLSRRFSKQG